MFDAPDGQGLGLRCALAEPGLGPTHALFVLRLWPWCVVVVQGPERRCVMRLVVFVVFSRLVAAWTPI